VSNFVSFATSIAELAHEEKSHTKSFSHLPSLFDAPETEAFALHNIARRVVKLLMRLHCESENNWN